MLSLYIHIPFCEKRCSYCDFYSITAHRNFREPYLRALKKEIDHVAAGSQLNSRPVKSVFFGGGTPNLYQTEELTDLLAALQSRFNILPDAEITLEMNPEFISDEKELERLQEGGFNRFSIGVQSLDNAELSLLGRLHDGERARAAMAMLNSAADGKWSADILFNIPGQSLESLHRTVEAMLEYEPAHISAYSLTREEGTEYDRALKEGEYAEADEEMQSAHFNFIHDFLNAEGYSHYEISNFARPGRESVHNRHYWDFGDYLGFGAGAHSKIAFRHFAHADNVNAYLRSADAGRFDHAFSETLDELSYLNEFLMLNLRRKKGILKNNTENKYFEIIEKALKNVQSRYDEEYFIFDKKGIRCNFRAWQVLDFLLNGIVMEIDKNY